MEIDVLTTEDIIRKFFGIEKKLKIFNAEIRGFSIFLLDSGNISSFLNVYYNLGHQGFGGYNLSKHNSLVDWINGILQITKKTKVEDVKVNQIIRILVHDGLIKAIGAPIEDEWFCPAYLYDTVKDLK